MRKVVFVLIALALGWSFPSTLHAQELQEGTWSGTLTGLGGGGRGPQDVIFEVKRIPDPHARWRSGTGEVLSVALLPQGRLTRLRGPGPMPLSDVRLKGETLSYRVTILQLDCSLMRQADGNFAGECVDEEEDEGQIFQITMIRPTG